MSPIPMQLLVGPNAPSGKKTTVRGEWLSMARQTNRGARRRHDLIATAASGVATWKQKLSSR